MEITIEESVLLEYIEKTSNRGEISHKGIHWLLKDILFTEWVAFGIKITKLFLQMKTKIHKLMKSINKNY
jgi:hypothetical protein